MRKFAELIPRGEAEVCADAETVCAALSAAHMLNIPDLMRLPLRSCGACAVTWQVMPRSIPHLRASDIPARERLILRR